MLARSPYKTAEDLGLNEPFYEGLLMVLDKMKKGEFVWTKKDKLVKNGFNMAFGWSGREYSAECGTVGCIAGWAFVLSPASNKIDSLIGAVTSIHEPTQQRANYWGLVMPEGYQNGHHTLEQAQIALESYLLTGKADWS